MRARHSPAARLNNIPHLLKEAPASQPGLLFWGISWRPFIFFQMLAPVAGTGPFPKGVVPFRFAFWSL